MSFIDREDEYKIILEKISSVVLSENFGGYANVRLLGELNRYLDELVDISENNSDVDIYCGNLKEYFAAALSSQRYERFGGLQKLRMFIRSDVGRLERRLEMAKIKHQH